ncbi:MAG: hypothetical protein IPM85_13660 [Chitinophagaceae bacterium]|nr:hypothetical protein [Chitinophagaceae bacterium]
MLILILILKLSFHPSYAQQSLTPFTSTATITNHPAKIVTVNASITGNKILLSWVVTDNRTADLFEVEKSTDGKNFSMAALVFGTEKDETGNYQFFEKSVTGQLISYRIKLVNKNKDAEYSTTVQVNKQQPVQ